MVKILVTHPRHWESMVAPEGVEVRHVSIGGPVPRRMNGQVSYDGIGEVVTDGGLTELHEIARAWKPDFFLFGIHMGFEKHALERFRSISPGTRFVMHYTDQRPSVSKFVKEHIGLLDLLLVTNTDKNDHRMYFRSGIPRVRVLYDGIDLREYWPQPMNPKWDVFFGGNNFWQVHLWMERNKNNTAPWIRKFSGARFRHVLLEELDRHCELLIRGEWGWNETDLNVKPPLFHPHYLNAMREGRIILSTINMPKYGLITRRMFRSIASGRMYLTQYCPGMEDHFENHRHMVWFHTVEEAIDLVRYYLAHDGAREKIAAQGRALVASCDTFHHRLGQFVQILKEAF